MKITKVPVLGIASVCASLFLFAATPALAQNCYPTHSALFSRVRSLENQAMSQGSADLAVRNLAGPKNEQCEDGAYRSFMEQFKDFAASAMRAPKTSRDKLLRLAISLIGQAPTRVSGKELKPSGSLFRQVRSDLNATADDVGFAQTPLLGQLLEVIGRVGPPTSNEPPPPATTTTVVEVQQPPPTTTAPTTTTTTTSSNNVQIRVPHEPLPPWAVIKLYEMRDNIKAQDLAAIQIKLQDIINWMESKTSTNP